VHVLVHDPETQPCREGRPTCSTRNGGLAARVAPCSCPCSCTTRKRSPAAKAALRARPGMVALPRGLPRARARARARPGNAALPRRPPHVIDPERWPCREGCPVLVHVLVHDPETQPCREGRPLLHPKRHRQRYPDPHRLPPVLRRLELHEPSDLERRLIQLLVPARLPQACVDDLSGLVNEEPYHDTP